MLLEKYADYLKTLGLSESTVKIYCRRLKNCLDRGYSESDLIGDVDNLISKHSKGGYDYDQKDRGNTVAALRRLKDYIRAPYMDSFFVAYDKGYSSFTEQNSYVSAYTITDGTITIFYKNGHAFLKTVTKKISKIHYGHLLDLFIKYKDYLSDSNTAITTAHGPGPAYRYVFGSCYGSNCVELFDAKKTDSVLTQAIREYQAWIRSLIPQL